jgi:hypothetical protein
VNEDEPSGGRTDELSFGRNLIRVRDIMLDLVIPLIAMSLGKESTEMRAHLDVETRLCSTERVEFARSWNDRRTANIKVDVKEMKVAIISRQRPPAFTLCKSLSHYLSCLLMETYETRLWRSFSSFQSRVFKSKKGRRKKVDRLNLVLTEFSWRAMNV